MPVVKLSRAGLGPAPVPRIIRHFGPGSWLVGPGCCCKRCRCIFAQLNDGNSSTADVFQSLYYIIVSSAVCVSLIVSTSGVCPVKCRRRAFQSVSINFCGHRAAAVDSAVMDYIELVAWLSGRTSVFGRCTFSVLHSTCS